MSVVLAITWVTLALLWTPTPAPTASKQPGDVTGAISTAPMPAGDEDRPHIGTSPALPAVPVVAQTGPRSGSKPPPPQLQAEPSPVTDSRLVLNVPFAAPDANQPTFPLPLLADAPRTTQREPGAPSGNAPQPLPDNAPIRVLISYAPNSAAARQDAVELVRLLRGSGLAASDPAPAARVASKAAITYYFAEDRDGARRVEHDLGEAFGAARLSPPPLGEALPRPGTIEVLVPAR